MAPRHRRRAREHADDLGRATDLGQAYLLLTVPTTYYLLSEAWPEPETSTNPTLTKFSLTLTLIRQTGQRADGEDQGSSPLPLGVAMLARKKWRSSFRLNGLALFTGAGI